MMQMRPVKERLFIRLIALCIHRCASGGAKVQERANKKPSGEPEGRQTLSESGGGTWHHYDQVAGTWLRTF